MDTYVSRVSRIVFIGLIAGVCICRSETVKAVAHIKEDQTKGTFVVNVPDLLEARRTIIGEEESYNFKILSQKMATPVAGTRGRYSHWVRLDPKSGVMTTSRKINRDEECAGISKCVVHIQAIMLPQTAFALLDLELIIDDVNDNAPMFDRDVIEIRISEAWSAGEIYNLDAFQAKDKDTGNFSVIYYEISANPYFALNQFTGKGGIRHLQLVVVNDLDHEKDSIVRMTLYATDGGWPAKKTQIPLTVRITDVNDNTPVFEKDEYVITLLENTPPGKIVHTVKANDEDTGAFGAVRYSISQRNSDLAQNLMSIDAATGDLTLRERADREQHNGIRILIEARDSDPNGHRSAQCWLVVTVDDVNDNSPVITTIFILPSKGDTVYISESSPSGIFVLRVSATDADSGDNGDVKMEINTSSPCAHKTSRSGGRAAEKQLFVLHSDGLVATSQTLDRELCEKHTIMVTACDHGTPPKCTSESVKVAVLDENEYAPKFRAATQRVTLRESARVGSHVTTLRAYDGDLATADAITMNKDKEIINSKNGEISYYITSGSRGQFSINRRTGVIRLLRPLDREQKAEWQITVTARDGASPVSLESSCVVIITVADVNDNRPHFTNPPLNNSLIYASIAEDVIITKLTAEDKDEGLNSKVSFKLIDDAVNDTTGLNVTKTNSSRAFVLYPGTGGLRLNFSRQNATGLIGQHVLRIRASDSGSPPLYSDITLRVMVAESPLAHWKQVNGFTVASGSDSIILAVSIGSVLVLLVVITLVAVIRCRAGVQNSKSNAPVDTEIAGVVVKPSDAHDDVISHFDDSNSVATQMISQADLPKHGRTSDSKEEADLIKSPEQDMNYLPVTQNFGALSPSHSDRDSGRGDSETDVVSCSAQKSDPKAVSPEPGTCAMGANCNEHCKTLGHSDTCWMPMIQNSGNQKQVLGRGEAATRKELKTDGLYTHGVVCQSRRYHHPQYVPHHMYAPRNRQPLQAVNNRQDYTQAKERPRVVEHNMNPPTFLYNLPSPPDTELHHVNRGVQNATCGYAVKMPLQHGRVSSPIPHVAVGSVGNLNRFYEKDRLAPRTASFSLRHDPRRAQNMSVIDELKQKHIRYANCLQTNSASQDIVPSIGPRTPIGVAPRTSVRLSMEETRDIIKDIDRLLL